MNWGKLVLFVCITTACSAQAVAQPKHKVPPAEISNAFRGKCERDPDGTRFAAKACYLDTAYDSALLSNIPAYRQPTCGSQEVTASQKEILARAYRLAPTYAQDKFCRLTKLFLTKAGASWGSWGLWEAPDRGEGKNIYIAISDRYLGEVPSFAALETDVLVQLLNVTPPVEAKLAPRFAAADDPAVAALGVLAHELGHLMLAVTNADGIYPEHPRLEKRGAPVSKCFKQAFIDPSWDTKGFQGSMQRWVDFGEQQKNKQRNISFNVSELRRGTDGARSDAIAGVYRSREFVSVFAAVRPEEDFVETFKYKVLADVKQANVKQPVTIEVPGQAGSMRLSSFLASRVIGNKVKCLRALKVFEVLRR